MTENKKDIDRSQRNAIILHTPDGLQILINCDDILTVSQLEKGTQIDLRDRNEFIVVQESFANVVGLKLTTWDIKAHLLANVSDSDIMPAWEPEEEKEDEEARTNWDE